MGEDKGGGDTIINDFNQLLIPPPLYPLPLGEGKVVVGQPLGPPLEKGEDNLCGCEKSP
jgi:hypothetical protein